MRFSVIYSFDILGELPVRHCNPPAKQLRKRLWQLTEGDECADPPDSPEGIKWKHRKWCAILSANEFNTFVRHCALIAQRTETSGSLGAPGFGFQAVPAIAFTGYDDVSECTAYVTPVPESTKEFKKMKNRGWNKIKDEIVGCYK